MPSARSTAQRNPRPTEWAEGFRRLTIELRVVFFDSVLSTEGRSGKNQSESPGKVTLAGLPEGRGLETLYSMPLRSAAMYMPNFLDGSDRLVAFDAETTGKRTPDAEFILKQPFAWRAPGIIIEVGFVEMLREGEGWRKGETWNSRVNPDGPSTPRPLKSTGLAC